MGFLDNFTTTSNSDNRWRVICLPEENTMTIGSSTTHTFSLPFVYSEYVNYCEVIYKQGVQIVLVKTDFTVQEENSTSGSSLLSVNLTQEDTCKFENSPCSTYVQIKIINYKNEVSYSTPSEIKVINSLDGGRTSKYGYLYKNKINDYLYEMSFEKLDYDYANNYVKDSNVSAGGCSSIRWDGYLGKNLDWFYSDSVSFIVRTKPTNGFYATIGVADAIDGLTVTTADKDTETYKVIPFLITDGINEKGLSMSHNTVHSWNNKPTITSGSKYDDVCSMMLVRYCLDRFESVAQLKQELPKHTSVFGLNSLLQKGYESKWIIADENETTILEIVNNKLKFISPIATKKAVSTNFHLSNVILNDDYTLFTPADVPSGYKPTEINEVEPYAVGLERHNYVIDMLGRVNGTIGLDDMRRTLTGLSYTRAYPTSYSPADPVWYTEFVGDKLTVDSLPTDFAGKLEEEGKNFEDRARNDGKTWFTEHRSIYDIKNKKLYICCQEDNDIEYGFKL